MKSTKLISSAIAMLICFISFGQEKTITGIITDCEDNAIIGVSIKNINSSIESFTDFSGKYKINISVGDELIFNFLGYESQKVVIENPDTINIKLKVIQNHVKPIMVKKPVIYLYPKQETKVTLQLAFEGKLLTTFPNYEGKWEIIATPNGQLYDTKTKRNYSSLFWDGQISFPKEHYQFDDGFVVEKEKLVSFLIEKLEYMGLNTSETNEFIQYWLPILETNQTNFIHFLVNEDYAIFSKNIVNPKPDSSIRIFMEFYGLDKKAIVKEQFLQKTERKGFTLVEWGGSDVSQIIKSLNPKI
jgi:hypothetical protein